MFANISHDLANFYIHNNNNNQNTCSKNYDVLYIQFKLKIENILNIFYSMQYLKNTTTRILKLHHSKKS